MAALVELPMLGLLREGPLHGYELKRRLENLVGFFGTVSYGSLYPMFHALELRQYVTRGSEGLGRIVYRITPKGRDRFIQLMHDPGVAVTQKLLFFEAIPPSERKQILKGHKEEWAKRLADYRQAQEEIDAHKVDRYRAALLAHEVECLGKDIVWLEQLIDEEAANTAQTRDTSRNSGPPSKPSRKRRQS